MLIIHRGGLPPRTRISGKWSALSLALCFIVSAVLVPVAAHLPHWLDFELVLGAWRCVWVIALSWILVNGHFVEDDPPRVQRLGALGAGPETGCAWMSLEG